MLSHGVICSLGGTHWPRSQDPAFAGRLEVISLEDSACFASNHSVDFNLVAKLYPDIGNLVFTQPSCEGQVNGSIY